jgi:pimeloyl-ACP methyl ester carboxylesterase
VRDLSSSIDVILERADQLNIDPERIATIGHSLGGAIALDTCHADERIDFCIDFEGAPFSTRTLDSGPGGPSLIVLSRAVYPEETRDANNGPGTFLLEMLNKGDEPGWFAEVAGGGHMSFSDAPHAMPETINKFGGVVMSAERSDEVYIALLAGMAKAIWGLSQFNSLDVVANSFEEVDLSTPDANEAPRND